MVLSWLARGYRVQITGDLGSEAKMDSLDPLGAALYGLQADDDEDEAMMSITDIPLNTAPAQAVVLPSNPFAQPRAAACAAASPLPTGGQRVSTLAQQWDRDNDAAKRSGKPQRTVGVPGTAQLRSITICFL